MGMFVQVVRWNWGKSESRRGCHVTDACDEEGACHCHTGIDSNCVVARWKKGGTR